MQSNNINRRDFLKLLSLTPLTFVKWPDNHLDRPLQNSQERPNILIVVFDSLTARNMSLYGYPRQTTPNLELIAQRATIFNRHYAGANFTTPGTATLLTGTYPWLHRALNLHGLVKNEFVEKNLFHILASQLSMFAYTHNPLANILLQQFRQDIYDWTELSDLYMVSESYVDNLFQNDYHTAYNGELLIYRSGGYPNSSFLLSHLLALKRYITETYTNTVHKHTFPRGVPIYPNEAGPGYAMFTLEQAIDWIQDQIVEQPKPFCGYVHLMPPHYPYRPRHDFYNKFEGGWQPQAKPERYFSEGHSQEFLDEERQYYDEFIAYVDYEFKRLYDFMERSGALENTYLIFTSDHGEMFERGIYTHNTPTLYEPLIHVPLLMWRPGQNRREDVNTLTSHVDLLPTLLHINGLPIPDWCEGQVLPTFGKNTIDAERSIYAMEARENPMNAHLEKATIAMLQGQYKLIHYIGYTPEVYELFNLEDDPEELNDLYLPTNPIAIELQKKMADKLLNSDHP